MSSPASDAIRPPAEDDVAAIVELFAPRPSDDDEILEWLRNPTFDVERDFRVAEHDGRLVAYADVHYEGERLYIDFAGALELLQPWAEQRAREQGGTRVRTWLWSVNDREDELLRRLGYTRTKYSFEMRIPLAEAAREPRVPQGILIRRPREDEDRSIHAVIEEAFRDSADRPPRPFEEWLNRVSGHDRTCWLVAETEGEGRLVGASVNRASAPGERHVGWIDALGVLRPWRKRGIATALLEASFQEFRARGSTHAGLGVDAENPTGALGVYERAGMSVHRTSAAYDKELDGHPD